MNSRELKLFNFRIPKQKTNSLLQLSKIEKVDLTRNMMLDFVLIAYNYAKLTFKKYSSLYYFFLVVVIFYFSSYINFKCKFKKRI